MKKEWVIVAILLPLLLGGAGGKVQSDQQASKSPFLDQGWTQEQRQEFYHKSQGTRLIPLPWLLALKQKGGTEPFLADANIVRFRFIPDSSHKFNEHGLPVGFAVTPFPSDRDKDVMVPWVGYTCAACHTGQIVANGKTVQIDGAPSMQNNLLLVGAMVAALKEMIGDPNKLDAFARAAYPSNNPNDEEKARVMVEKDVGKFLDTLDKLSGKQAIEWAKQNCTDDDMRKKFTDTFSVFPETTWGFGRLDAIGRASNTVFFLPPGGFVEPTPFMHPCNLDTADGQVSIPKIWNAWKYTWVQWNAFVENPLARNLAQALALGAHPGKEQEPKLRTVNLKALGWLEDRLHSLKPPRWEEVFGPVDSKLADEGEVLYRKGRPNRQVKGGLCAHCHFLEPRELDCDGKPEIPMVMVQIHETGEDREAIGTDDTTMANYVMRAKKLAKPSPEGDKFQPAVAMARITSDVMESGFKAEGIDKPEQDRMQRCRGNTWWSKKQYKAPTHDGVWATAPYLHNGSIPNLYLVLSPKEERDKQARTFCVGHDLTYDPVNVGFNLTDQCPDPFKFDTTLRNNGNMGHEFHNAKDCEKREGQPGENGVLGCELSDHERKALVEYLKTL